MSWNVSCLETMRKMRWRVSTSTLRPFPRMFAVVRRSSKISLSTRFALAHFLFLVFNPAVLQRLGKNPEDYPDAKSQPHVQVALRMKAKGLTARTGTVVQYIFCRAEGEESSKTAQADRAKHPDEIKRSEGELKIGRLPSHFLIWRQGLTQLAQITSFILPIRSSLLLNGCAIPLKGLIVHALQNAWVSL